jgi:thiamine pyrophosphate-dependent acetolactate synthase large subunit-like protein
LSYQLKIAAMGENGTYSLIRSLLASGVDTCFANPGTSEMHFVAALDRVPEMRAVLALAETVVTGAANAGPRATKLMDLRDPQLDWVALTKGMGVEASRVTTIAEFTAQFKDAIAHKGPRLIEAVI